MRLLVLSRSRLLHSTHRFVEEARKLDFQCDVVNPVACKLIINQQGNCEIGYRNRLLQDVDVVIPRIGVRTMNFGLLVLQQFESAGLPVLNKSIAIQHVRNKFHCMQLMAGNGIKTPKTVISQSLQDLAKIHEEFDRFPVVIKTLKGAQGIGVMLANDQATLESIALTFIAEDKPVMIQEYIRESNGADIRVMVIDGRCVAAMKREAAGGEFRSNVHRGGRGNIIEITPEVGEIAIAATAAAGLDVAGVDILESNRGPLVLEVNPSPGFRELEIATGINIAREFVASAAKRVSSHDYN